MTPRKQHQIAERLEDQLSAIEARADTLLMVGLKIGEEYNERDGAALCQLAYDIRRDCRKAEKRRAKLSKALHPAAAYPKATPEQAGHTDPTT